MLTPCSFLFLIFFSFVFSLFLSILGKSKSGRNGEPIFNVFDGLLADIESLRNTGPEASEWDDDEDVYNTPEAARARIAFDVKALRDEVWTGERERWEGVGTREEGRRRERKCHV